MRSQLQAKVSPQLSHEIRMQQSSSVSLSLLRIQGEAEICTESPRHQVPQDDRGVGSTCEGGQGW